MVKWGQTLVIEGLTFDLDHVIYINGVKNYVYTTAAWFPYTKTIKETLTSGEEYGNMTTVSILQVENDNVLLDIWYTTSSIVEFRNDVKSFLKDIRD